METTITAALIGGAAVFSILFVKYCVYKPLVDRVIIWEYEKGLKYHKGRFVKLLDPGVYWILKLDSRIDRIDMRPSTFAVVGQEVLSSDSISLKVSVSGTYQVVDPYVAMNLVQNYFQSLYLTVQVVMRDIIGSRPIDELLENRSSFDRQLMEQSEKKFEELGLKLISVNVRDIMFPGELKRVFSKVVEARKEGLAALERARGETAALRNLANAAKLMDNNPALLQLRMLQSLAQTAGNTLVLNCAPGDNPVLLKAKQGEGSRTPPTE
ncbi:MAG: slipin family protein [Thermodesulfobacteriota bacterium]